jgi:integrase
MNGQPLPTQTQITHKKRGVKKIRKLLTLIEVYDLLEKNRISYKKHFELWERDKALIALLLLSGLRINEALRLKLKQFDFTDGHFIIIKDVQTSKKGLPREEIPLPLEGKLSPFTTILKEWLVKLPSSESYVIPSASMFGIHWNKPLSRQRSHYIVKQLTGFFPHYYRSLCESHYGRIFKTNWALKDFMGLTDLRSTEPYVKTDWRDYQQKMIE